ncbi:MAG TPA: bacteriohemerythrin [Bryobacteraceae bacterium]
MHLFEWKPAYRIGHAEIDAQHQHLFRLASELNQAMTAGTSRIVLESILASLITYTQRHFADEERLMLKYQYPEYRLHKAAHDKLTAQVVAFHTDFKAGRSVMTIDLLHFLKNWLAHHIGHVDQKVALFLKEQGTASRDFPRVPATPPATP